ncbi:MAG TPA: glycerol kinase GlpK [Bacillota bacterium]|mgnify:CR=1 FL=1|nr:glycerol kinase GlpK [Bacillota bacterium]
MSKYVMALDAGTTSNRCIIFDRGGNQVAVAQKEFTQIYPRPGWVEHDAMEIWATQLGVAKEAILKAGAEAKDIAGIGITNQRETTIVWNRETGLPICNAIVWQCRRTADFCRELENRGLGDMIKQKTGLKLDAYFSATKIRWILDNVPGARRLANEGKLLFGTVDTWLIWKLTRGKVHVTDYSNASRTMLYNIHELCWDKDILELLEISENMLPQVRESSEIYGETDYTLFGDGIRIAGAAGDQQAALFGQTCFGRGEAKNTYGTGCFLLMNTGEKAVESKNGLVTTIAWGLDGKISYALEGSVFVAGAAIQWLRDELGLIENSPASECCAKSVSDSNGVYFVPAFVGLGAPYWDPDARGAVFGLTRGANKHHIVRAALESLAYQTCDVLFAMEQDSGIRLDSLKVDGGACANDFLMQFQADMIQREVRRPSCVETTALGAAYLAGLAAGYWSGLGDIKANWQISGSFVPRVKTDEARAKIAGWHTAVSAARAFKPQI